MKKLYSLFLIVLYPALAFLQPVPCLEDPPEMTSLCESACIICDIDGFTGRHNSATPGVAPADFCTIVVHNAQWIAFIAGSEDLEVEIAVSNCQLDFGLEVGLYEGIDCTNFRRVSNCEGGTNTPIGPGTQRVLSNSEPLVIGQYYYVVMDGAFGDNCDWTISVLQGSTAVAPLTAAPLIEGPDQVCPELLATYTTPGVPGGNELLWTLNGLEIGTADSIVIGWPDAGLYELCLSISNVCDQAPISCRSIVVASLPPMVFDETICAGDCFVLHDALELCEEGVFEFNFPTAAGCDSIVMVNLTVIESDETSLAATICEGDTLTVGGIPFFNQGTYTTVLQNTLGCDSTVVLELDLIVCEIEGQAQEISVVCRGEASGQIAFFVTNGTAPFNYTWQRLGGLGTGSGMLSGINVSETLSGLVAGTYLITINDDFGNDLVLIQEVTEPEQLTAELLASNYNGFNLTCQNSADGTLTVAAQGGVMPYTYAWDNGMTTAEISALAAGEYTVQITDAVGCSLTQSAALTEPLPLALAATFTDADCGGDDTGEIRVLEASGGVPPYLFSLNDGPLSGEQVFSNLTGGDYTLRIEDANGCTAETSGSLQTRIIPVLSLPADTSLELAEEYTLRPVANVPLEVVLWQPATGLSCTACPFPTLTATETTVYTLAVTSVDGCTTVDSVRITVLDVRDVFVPNVFSPNNDGVNDELIVFGGPEVLRIRSFRVFNRWGDLVYETTGLLPNSNDQAWNGRFDGKEPGFSVFDYIDFLGGFERMMSQGGGMVSINEGELGVPLDFANGGGLNTTQALGLNYNRDFGENTSFSSNYFGSILSRDINESFVRNNFLADGTFVASGSSKEESRTTGHRINTEIQHEINDRQRIIARVKAGYTNGRTVRQQSLFNFDGAGRLTNKSHQAYRYTPDRWQLGADIQYFLKFSTVGRVFTAGGQYDQSSSMAGGWSLDTFLLLKDHQLTNLQPNRRSAPYPQALPRPPTG